MELEAPEKPRRLKKANVPVHGSNKNLEENELKTYSAQFNSRKKCKHKNDLGNKQVDQENGNNRISKKSLINANEQFYNENQELNGRLNELEEYSTRKIEHLKGKLDSTKKYSQDLITENNVIKTQYQDILIQLENCQEKLESLKQCKSCEELKVNNERLTSSHNMLQTVNGQLNEDINMLKNVVYRLNVQLERYQEKLRTNNIQVKPLIVSPVKKDNPENFKTVSKEIINCLPENHSNHHHFPISWGSVNSHTLGPLLDAYQEAISEKEEIIQNYEAELSNFTGKLHSIVEENEDLHKKLTVDDECSSKLNVELDKVKNELKSTKDQNDLLIKKCALKQNKLEEILNCYEKKIDQLRTDYNVVVDQYHKSRTEVTALKEKNKSLVDYQDEFKNERQNYIPVSVHTASVNECKKWYEELKQQYEQEKTKLREGVDQLTNQIKEHTGAISNIKAEKEELESKIKMGEKHLKKTESKCLDIQHTLHEVQLSRSACRKQLHKVMNFARDLVTEQETLLNALHQRQQENKVVKQIGSDIAIRMDSLKSQLKEVQKDAWHELSTVEQRLQDKDDVIVSMRRQHEEQVEKLKSIIKQKEECNLLLKESNSSIPNPPYLLLNERNIQK